MLEHIYTPISLIKKSFKAGERSLAREEIAHRLQAMFGVEDSAADSFIQLSLDRPSSPLREGSSRAVIEYVQESQPLSQHAWKILQDSGSPLTEEQILRKLRSLNLVSWSFSFDRLGLLGDHRFSQLNDGRWIISEWEIVNDDIFELIQRKETKELPIKDVPYIMQMSKGLSKRKGLFLPELDSRFEISEDKIYLHESSVTVMENETIPSSDSHILDINQTTIMEVAAAMNQETLELVQEKQEKTVVDQVVEDLMGALIKLEKRSAEMKEEVLSHFTANNLDAIKSLMSEKEKNERVLLKIKDIVDELS